MRFVVGWLVVGALAFGGCAKPYLAARPDTPPFAAVPADVTHATETFAASDGLTLFGQSWRPTDGTPRGVLVVMHGLRDHGDRYATFAAGLRPSRRA